MKKKKQGKYTFFFGGSCVVPHKSCHMARQGTLFGDTAGNFFCGTAQEELFVEKNVVSLTNQLTTGTTTSSSGKELDFVIIGNK